MHIVGKRLRNFSRNMKNTVNSNSLIVKRFGVQTLRNQWYVERKHIMILLRALRTLNMKWLKDELLVTFTELKQELSIRREITLRRPVWEETNQLMNTRTG